MAVAIHLVLYLATLLSPPRPPLHLPSEMPGDAVTVTLAGFTPRSAGGASGSPAEASAFEAMEQRLSSGEGAQPPVEPAPRRGDLDALFGPRNPPGPATDARTAQASGQKGQTAGSGRARDPRDQVSLARVGAGLRTGPTAVADQPGEPCWRRPAARLPVRMVVMLTDGGEVIGAPRLVRRGGAAAEAAAWRAMAGCAPYSAAPAGRYRLVELDFAGGRDWVRPAGFLDIR